MAEQTTEAPSSCNSTPWPHCIRSAHFWPLSISELYAAMALFGTMLVPKWIGGAPSKVGGSKTCEHEGNARVHAILLGGCAWVDGGVFLLCASLRRWLEDVHGKHVAQSVPITASRHRRANSGRLSSCYDRPCPLSPGQRWGHRSSSCQFPMPSRNCHLTESPDQ